MKTAHRWRQHAETDVACMDCGTEPWQRNARNACPNPPTPHRTPSMTWCRPCRRYVHLDHNKCAATLEENR